MSAETPRSNLLIHFAAAIVGIGGVLFGFDFVVIGGAILYIKGQFMLGAGEVEVVVAAALIGALLFTPVAGWLADRFGRRTILIIVSGLGIVGAIGSATVDNMAWLFLARMASGAAIGSISILAPLFISEVADTEHRGKLVGCFVIGGVMGTVFAYLIDWLLAPGAHWRIMFIFAALPATILLVGMIVLPETPRWLVHQGRHDHARASLRRLCNVCDVERELLDLINAVSPPGRWTDLLKPAALKAVFAGNALAFFREVTGFTALILYAPEIFAAAGFAAKGLRIFESMLMTLFLLAGSIIATFLVDRLGRKPMLITGLSTMTVSMVILTVSIALVSSVPVLGYVAVGAAMVWMLGFGMGPATVFFVIISEIYPQAVRARGMSVVGIVRWSCDVVVSVSFLTVVAWLGDAGTFAIFAAISLVGIMTCLIMIRETRGQSLEQLQKTG